MTLSLYTSIVCHQVQIMLLCMFFNELKMIEMIDLIIKQAFDRLND